MSRPQTASEAAEADLMVMFEFSRQKQDIKSFKLQFKKTDFIIAVMTWKVIFSLFFQLAYEDPDKKVFHLCIVNLVIGTLYCAKGNYEFGISRVIKSLEPYNKKLGTDTWFYAKRCFLSLIENLAKHMISVRDSVVQECIGFLEQCEIYGKNVKTVIEQPLEEVQLHRGKNTVTYEARLLKALLLQLEME